RAGLYSRSAARWAGSLLLLSAKTTAGLGMRLTPLGTFIAASYLHAAWDATRQKSYALVWLAYLVAASISLFGAFFPGLLHQPGGLGMGPFFWPGMALAVGAASLPLFQIA